MSNRIIKEGLTYDDVLLIPAHSDVLPREVDITSNFTREIKLRLPMVSSAMDTVTDARVAEAFARLGGIGVIHKNMPLDQQTAQVAQVKACTDEAGHALLVAAAVGINARSLDNIDALIGVGADAVVLDTAHGHSQMVLDTIRKARKAFPKIQIVAGNIATAEAALALKECGVDAVKVGIGPGSICTTRIIAGIGVPQLTAILDTAEALEGSGIPIIADGGIRYSGDIVKALAAGASTIMAGSLFAGTDETPGTVIVMNGQKYKAYRGMGSLEAMQKGSKDRYFQDMEADIKKLVPEGVTAHVPYRGPLADVVYQLVGGIRSGMGYCGARTIPELRNAKFIKITAAGMVESHPHDLAAFCEAPNYKR